MNENTYETWKFFFRKKIRRINLLALLADADGVLWRPAVNEQFMLAHAIIKIHNIGVNSDAPNIRLRANAVDIVAAVDTLVADGAVQRLAVVGNQVIDHDHPLTLAILDAPAGSTTLDMTLVLIAFKISDIG